MCKSNYTTALCLACIRACRKYINSSAWLYRDGSIIKYQFTLHYITSRHINTRDITLHYITCGTFLGFSKVHIHGIHMGFTYVKVQNHMWILYNWNKTHVGYICFTREAHKYRTCVPFVKIITGETHAFWLLSHTCGFAGFWNYVKHMWVTFFI